MNSYYYTTLDDTIISVSMKAILDSNLLSMSGGSVLYELRINEEVADSHEHKARPKPGSMFAILEQDSRKRSIRVDVSPGIFKVKYKLTVDDAEVALNKISESELKGLWHKRKI